MDERQPADVATQLARETGNILVAEATASLYLAAAENSAWAQFWREVLETLQCRDVIDDEATPVRILGSSWLRFTSL
jgi:hypothetical protein